MINRNELLEYQDNTRVINLLKIMTQLSPDVLQSNQQLNDLEKTLMQQGYLSLDEQPLNTLLRQISLLSSVEAEELRGFFSDKMSHPVTASVIKTLDYAAIDEKKRKFLKFDKVLNEIELEIDTSISLSLQEFYQFIIEDAQEALINSDDDLAVINYLESKPVVTEEVRQEVIEINSSSDFDRYEYLDNKIVKIQSAVSLNKAFIFKNCIIDFHDKLTIHFHDVEQIQFIDCELNFHEFDEVFIETSSDRGFFSTFGSNHDDEDDDWDEDDDYEEEVPNKNLIFDTCRFTTKDFYWDPEQSCMALHYGLNVRFYKCEFKQMKNVIYYKDSWGIGLSYKDYYLRFKDCSFEKCKGYIVDSCKVPFHFESSSVNQHQSLISMEVEEYDEIEVTGSFLFNLENSKQKIQLQDSKFNEVAMPILYSINGDKLDVLSCEFQYCESLFPIIHCSYSGNHEFKNNVFINCMNIYVDGENVSYSDCETVFEQCSFYRSRAAFYSIDSEEVKSLEEQGGALHLTNGSVLIRDCKFEECYAGIGGAIYAGIEEDFIEIIDSQFISCQSEEEGSAIRIYGENDGVAYLIGNKFINCKANNSSDEIEIDCVDNVRIRQ